MLIELVQARRNLQQRCKELFTDEKLADQFYRYFCEALEDCEQQKSTKLSSVNVREVKKAIWKEFSPSKNLFSCSACGQWGEEFWRYCPRCGAKMDKEYDCVSGFNRIE